MSELFVNEKVAKRLEHYTKPNDKYMYGAYKLAQKLNEKCGFKILGVEYINKFGQSEINKNNDKSILGFTMCCKDGFFVGIACAWNANTNSDNITYEFHCVFEILQQSGGQDRHTTESIQMSRVVNTVYERVNLINKRDNCNVIDRVGQFSKLPISILDDDAMDNKISNVNMDGLQLYALLNKALDGEHVNDLKEAVVKQKQIKELLEKKASLKKIMPQKVGKPYTVILNKVGMEHVYFIGKMRNIPDKEGKFREYEIVEPFKPYDSIEEYDDDLHHRLLIWKLDEYEKAKNNPDASTHDKVFGEYFISNDDRSHWGNYDFAYHSDHDIVSINFNTHYYRNKAIDCMVGLAILD